MVDIERQQHSGSWPHAPIVARRRSSRAGWSLPTAREFYSGLALLTLCGMVVMMRGGPSPSRAESSNPAQPQAGARLREAIFEAQSTPAAQLPTSQTQKKARSEVSGPSSAFIGD